MNSLKIMTTDNVEFTISKNFRSVTVQNLLADLGDYDLVIPLAVDSSLMKIIINFHEKEEEANLLAEPEKAQKLALLQDEIRNIEPIVLNKLLMTVNYLDYKTLFDVCCQRVADLIKEKSVEELRTIFGIVNDFTPEEEEQVKKETEWAEED